ncbi:MAG: serine hydrolase [Planctomycetota bacterium]
MRTLPVLSTLLLAAIVSSQQTPSAQQSTAALAEQVDLLCKPLIASELAVGFVVGVIDRDTELVRGYGVIERGRADAPDGDTVYEIGSVSKVFTGLLLADAVERGVVALDDPVQKYLPEGVVLQTFQEKPVLLWHLSTHTSGLPRLPDMSGSDPKDPYAHFTAERLYEVLPQATVRWEPGSKYEYSNLAVGLLGHVLARVQGVSYDDLLRKLLVGMPNTTVALDLVGKARLAPPYDSDCEPNHTWALAELAGAGGIHSTVRDLLHFAYMHWMAAPGSAARSLAMQKRHDGANGIALGLGWHIARDGITYWHNGQTGGYHAYIGVEPSLQRAVCILANTSRGEVDAIGERILQHLNGIAVEPLKIEMPATIERQELQRLVGHYSMSPGAMFDITLQDKGLFAKLTGQPAVRIYPRSATEFFYRAVEASITFELEGDAVKALVLHQNGRDMRCLRVPSDGADK